jgi:hypothetical protein
MHNAARAEYNRQGGAGLGAEPAKSPGVILFAWGMSMFNGKSTITVVLRVHGKCALLVSGAPIRER